jgi:hypothetical protein
MNETPYFKLTIQKQRYKPTQIDKYITVYYLKKLSQFQYKTNIAHRSRYDLHQTKAIALLK